MVFSIAYSPVTILVGTQVTASITEMLNGNPVVGDTVNFVGTGPDDITTVTGSGVTNIAGVATITFAATAPTGIWQGVAASTQTGESSQQVPFTRQIACDFRSPQTHLMRLLPALCGYCLHTAEGVILMTNRKVYILNRAPSRIT